MLLSIALLVFGLTMLVFAADYFIKGAVAIANKLGVAPIVIGLTIVSFGTSAPELVISINSALKGADGILLGNIIGSNLANTLLILGAAAVIAPIVMPKTFFKDTLWMLAATALLTAGVLFGVFSWPLGITMLVLLGIFVYSNYKSGDNVASADETSSPWASKSWFYIICGTIIALSGVVWGANLLVDNAVLIAAALNVPNEIIGLTIVAIGTSLPELAISCTAAARGQSDIAIGNVVGSNLWNILFILGATSCLSTVSVPVQIAQWDIWVLLVATVAMICFISAGKRISRKNGLVLLCMYAMYMFAFIQ